jgi:hypothetical protein
MHNDVDKVTVTIAGAEKSTFVCMMHGHSVANYVLR